MILNHVSLVTGKELLINYENNVEIVIVNDKLCFIDNNGYHKLVYDYPLEDLIDILIKLKGRT